MRGEGSGFRGWMMKWGVHLLVSFPVPPYPLLSLILSASKSQLQSLLSPSRLPSQHILTSTAPPTGGKMPLTGRHSTPSSVLSLRISPHFSLTVKCNTTHFQGPRFKFPVKSCFHVNHSGGVGGWVLFIVIQHTAMLNQQGHRIKE